MKTNLLLLSAAFVGICFAPNKIQAQDAIIVEETTLTFEQPVECKNYYSSSWRDNWFIQLGAGAQMPFTDYGLPDGSEKRHITAVYNAGFGRWFSPYLGFRVSGMYGKMRWDFVQRNKVHMATANADLMWDMTSSILGVNPNRIFSFIPFVGVGGTFTWDFKEGGSNVLTSDQDHRKRNQWTLPVSVGFQLRFRLCKYADFFAEARTQFYGDNFNNYVQGSPIEANISAIGGISFALGGRNFSCYNPCNDLGYINQLNNQVNNLRAELVATSAALAAANNQLPCPEVEEVEIIEQIEAPMSSTVSFNINSDVISDKERVNIYNVAQWLKNNPDATITIQGYADIDTGTAEYNQKLSERRAQAVNNILVNDYGIAQKRLTVKAYGSATQPYSENDWNRIVIFSQP